MFTHKGKYLKPPLKIIGGKQKSRDILYELFPPRREMLLFLEPFLGSGAVFMGSPRTREAALNDINSDIINFYRQLQASPDALWARIQVHLEELKERGKEKFIELRDQRAQVENDALELAAWLYIINKSCFNGIIRYSADGKCNSSYCGTFKGRGWLTERWLWELWGRLEGAELHSEEFDTFLARYNHVDTTFIFLDPPYFLRGEEDPAGTVTIYNGKKFTTQDHERLASYLESTKSRWLMTINDCEWVRKRYAKYHMIVNKIFYSCSQTPAGRCLKDELIIANYPIASTREGFEKIS